MAGQEPRVTLHFTPTSGSWLNLVELVHHLTERERVEDRWRHLATHDPLTGLANRALLRVALDSAVAEAGRGGSPVSLAMCDVDGFKQVNDTYGHPSGDLLLQTVAERLQAAVRPGDLVTRISGDEFVLVLNDADPVTASRIAHRVLAQVRRSLTLPDGDVMVPSVSVGVATCGEADTAHDLYARADRAMYEAKRAGGNRNAPPGAAVPAGQRGD